MSDKGEPFYALPAAFMRRTRISIVGKVVYCYLVDRLRLIERFPGRFPYPTERSIAAALGTTERAVRRTLARLKSANVIEVERPKGKATNRYKLLLDTGRNVLNTPDETSAEHRTSRPHNTGRNVLNTADETSALLQNSEIQNTHNGACSAVEQAFRAAFANGRTLTRPRLAEIQVAARDWAAAGYSPDLVAPALADLKRKYELIGPLGLVKHVNEYDRMAQVAPHLAH